MCALCGGGVFLVNISQLVDALASRPERISMTNFESLPYEIRLRIFTTAKRKGFARHLHLSGDRIKQSLVSWTQRTWRELGDEVYTLARPPFSMTKLVFTDEWRVRTDNSERGAYNIVFVHDDYGVSYWPLQNG